jgi:hypothetical protein
MISKGNFSVDLSFTLFNSVEEKNHRDKREQQSFTERIVLYQELGIRNQELKKFPLYPFKSTLLNLPSTL